MKTAFFKTRSFIPLLPYLFDLRCRHFSNAHIYNAHEKFAHYFNALILFSAQVWSTLFPNTKHEKIIKIDSTKLIDTSNPTVKKTPHEKKTDSKRKAPPICKHGKINRAPKRIRSPHNELAKRKPITHVLLEHVSSEAFSRAFFSMAVGFFDWRYNGFFVFRPR